MSSKEKFYCVKCRKNVQVDAQNIIGVVTFANDRPALKAECTKCLRRTDGTSAQKTKLYRIISEEDKQQMEKKYGKCKK
jgi:hypothetical protein